VIEAARVVREDVGPHKRLTVEVEAVSLSAAGVRDLIGALQAELDLMEATCAHDQHYARIVGRRAVRYGATHTPGGETLHEPCPMRATMIS
jgi:hypothetical protein